MLFVSFSCAAQYVPTPNIGLQIPANGSTNWNVPLNFNFNKLDQIMGGTLAVPSFHVSGNLLVDGSIQAGSFIGAGGSSFPTISGTITPGRCAQWVSANTVGQATAPCGSGGTFSLTTIGSSGAATYTAGVLNIPTYTGGSVPTGSGFFHITGGVQDAAARPVDLSSIDATGTLAAGRMPAYTGDVGSAAGGLVMTITSGAVTNAKLASPTTTVNGQPCTLGSTCTIPVGGATPTGTGIPKIIAGVQQAAASPIDLSSTDATGTLAAGRTPAYTGDVTSSAGSLANTITPGAVTNAKLASPTTTVNGQPCTLGSTCTIPVGGATPTGTGFPRIIAGTQQAAASPVDLSGADATGTIAAGREPARTGDVSNAAGSLVTLIGNGAVTNTKLANSSTTVNGVTCALGSPCTVPVGSGTLTNFTASSFPPWIVPSVTNSTTTPNLTVATPTQTADQFLASPCGATGPVGVRGICLADLPNSSIVHLAGMSMYLDFLPQHINAGVVQDQSGNANNATFGATPPISMSIGITNSNTSSVNLPAAVNGTRTFQWAFNIQPYSIIAGFGTYVGSTLNTAPSFLQGGYTGGTSFNGLPALALYLASTGTTSTNTQVYLPTGNHDIIVTLGTGAGDLDRYFFDGIEVGSYTSQSFNAGLATSGNYVIGNNPTLPNAGFVGDMYEFITRTAELTPAQVLQEHKAMLADVYLRGTGGAGLPWNAAGPNLVCLGDSICAGLGGTVNWFGNLTLSSTIAPFTLVNLGNPGKSSAAINYSSADLARQYCNSNGGPNTVLVQNGTNDFGIFPTATGISVGSSISGEVQLYSAAGCKVFVGTMISRGNALASPVNGQTWPVNKNSLNAQIRLMAKSWGAVGILDFAADPLVGCDTCNANTTYYNTDQTHPTNAGYALMATGASNSINYAMGTSRAAPGSIAATTYQMLASDGYTEAGITANATWTLPSCIGQTVAL